MMAEVFRRMWCTMWISAPSASCSRASRWFLLTNLLIATLLVRLALHQGVARQTVAILDFLCGQRRDVEHPRLQLLPRGAVVRGVVLVLGTLEVRASESVAAHVLIDEPTAEEFDQSLGERHVFRRGVHGEQAPASLPSAVAADTVRLEVVERGAFFALGGRPADVHHFRDSCRLDIHVVAVSRP